jgi:hypothetical protein
MAELGGDDFVATCKGYAEGKDNEMVRQLVTGDRYGREYRNHGQR